MIWFILYLITGLLLSFVLLVLDLNSNNKGVPLNDFIFVAFLSMLFWPILFPVTLMQEFKNVKIKKWW